MVGPAVRADVLGDHVHDDVLLGDGGEDAMADARLVGHAVSDTRPSSLTMAAPQTTTLAHPVRFGHDPGALDVA